MDEYVNLLQRIKVLLIFRQDVSVGELDHQRLVKQLLLMRQDAWVRLFEIDPRPFGNRRFFEFFRFNVGIRIFFLLWVFRFFLQVAVFVDKVFVVVLFKVAFFKGKLKDRQIIKNSSKIIVSFSKRIKLLNCSWQRLQNCSQIVNILWIQLGK